MSDFFKKDPPTGAEEKPMDNQGQQAETVEKIKVGEKEYTQDELSHLVGLGELGREAEQKYNIKIDKVWPNFNQTINEKKELEKRLADIEQEKIQKKAEDNQQLSPEELKQVAIAEADKLGLVHMGNINKFIATFLEARDIRDDAEAIVETAKQEGKPVDTVDELIDYMVQNGLKNPEIAYKIKHERELDEWKEKQLSKIKNSDMHTLDTSTAGSKNPEPLKLTDLESLRNALKSAIRKE